MANIIFLPLIFAIVSPFLFGLSNVLDKFAVTRKVKVPLSFTILAGIVNLVIGLILLPFLNWRGVTLTQLFFPAVAGLIFGTQYFLYDFLLEKEDASSVIGIVYFYPVLVAILSFLFLNERLSLVSYLGMFLIMIGVLMLSVKSKKIRFRISLWIIVSFIVIVALYEFFVKIAVSSLSELNGASISQVFIGLVILPGLFNKKIRNGFFGEIKNFKWAIFSESLNFLGVYTTYLAMAALPATIVSSISATQPFAVLIFEFFAIRFGIRISEKNIFAKRGIPILIIVIGVLLLYLPEIIRGIS